MRTCSCASAPAHRTQRAVRRCGSRPVIFTPPHGIPPGTRLPARGSPVADEAPAAELWCRAEMTRIGLVNPFDLAGRVARYALGTAGWIADRVVPAVTAAVLDRLDLD